MQIPSSMTETEKLCYLTNKLGEFIDMRIDKYLYQIELRKKILLAEEDKNRLTRKVRKVLNEIECLTKQWGVLNGKETESSN